MKVCKILTALSIAFSLFFSMPNAYALEEIGSIHIKLADSNTAESKKDVKFAIEKVANVKDGDFQLVGNFQKSQIDLAKIKTANDLKNASEKLINYVDNPMEVKNTNGEGIVEFNNLEVAVYLLYVVDNNKYDEVEPLLISIPTFDQVSHQMNYHVEVLPKHSPELHPTIADTGDHTKVVGILTLMTMSLLGIYFIKKREV